jgi:geranylgeranyl pyrophosphate synthase
MAEASAPIGRDLKARWASVQERYARVLVDRLRLGSPLDEVARWALDGGKRLRPLLVELVGEAVGAPAAALVEAGVAVEYLHTASMLLDDLPCMDGAAERRGRPPAHVRFSEAEAILAAVALLARSTDVLLEAPVDAATARAMATLASDTVAATMTMGQALELRGTAPVSATEIRDIHERKTASLFALAGRLAAAGAGPAVDATTTTRIVDFATLFGRAYQVADDVEDRAEAGEARGNLARIVGAEAARDEAVTLLRAARDAATETKASALVECVDWLERKVGQTR